MSLYRYVLARPFQAFGNQSGRLLLCRLLTSSLHRVTFACTVPPFGQALLTGTQTGSPQIRTWSIPAQVPHLPMLRFSVRFRCQQPAHLESSASYVVSVRHLAGLGEKRSGWRISNPAFTHLFASCLSTDCYLPAVAFASY